MYSLMTLIIAVLTALVSGGLIGLALSHALSGNEKKIRELKAELDATEDKLNGYQQEVTDHFSETAQLVNKLTQSYKDVHEHLAGSALKLANVDMTHQLLGHTENTAQSTAIEGSLTTQSDNHNGGLNNPSAQGVESPLNDPFTDEAFDEAIEEQSANDINRDENDKTYNSIESESDTTKEKETQETVVSQV